MTNNQKGMSMPIILGIIVLIVAVGAVFMFLAREPEDKDAMEESLTMMMKDKELTKDTMMKEMDDVMMKDMMTMTYEYSGQLQDVTGGNASGVAKANFTDGTYSLLATFENLPDPEGTDFYEGWIVRRGDAFDVISTGKVEKTDDVYTNMYSSGDDLTDHDFYVLTIEPNDGDPAPAGHIVEGVMKKNGNAMMKKDADTMMETTKVFSVAGQSFSFSETEIRVKKGDTVKMNFESVGGFHDWAVDEFNAKTVRVNTGGTTSVEFVADKAGTFEYYCSVGNHRQQGMKGNLIVE